MAGAKRDDLVVVSRDGKDYRSTLERINLPISAYPELEEEKPKPWDHLPVLFHVIVEDVGRCLVGERDFDADEYTFEIYNKDTEEQLDLTSMLKATNVKEDQSFFVPKRAKREKTKKERQEKNKTREASGFDGGGYYYSGDSGLPSIQLPRGEWIIGCVSEPVSDDWEKYYGPSHVGCDFYESRGDFELGPLTNTSKLEDFSNLFMYCESWNNAGKPLPAGFKTDSAKVLCMMFYNCGVFNQPVNHLKVDNVFNFDSVFSGCALFNQEVDQWNVGNGEDFYSTFDCCYEWNGDVSGWDMSNATTIMYMFDGCSKFNGDVSQWKLSNAEYMTGVFNACTEFDCDISGWDVSNVGDFSDMFKRAEKFNQDISGWDVSSASFMGGMFNSAESFNQDLSGWCVGKIWSEPSRFDYGARSWVKARPAWGTCP